MIYINNVLGVMLGMGDTHSYFSRWYILITY